MSQPDPTLASLLPFASRACAVRGGRMQYVDEGNGAPALLVHGNPTWSYLYRAFIPPLATDHRVIAPDHLGFGLSERPASAPYDLPWHIANLSDLVRSLDLEDITLVVHDWGGPIGIGAALELGERVRRLVVINSWAWRLPSGTKLAPLLEAIREPQRGERLALDHNVLVEQGLPGGVHRRERLTPEVHDAYRRVSGDPESRRAIMTLVRAIPVGATGPAAQAMASIERRLGQLRLPTLLLWGKRDPIFPPATVALWRRFIPDAEVAYLSDASHFVQEDAPEEAVALLRGWLATQPSR